MSFPPAKYSNSEFEKLLLLIKVPADRRGMRDALQNLERAAQAVTGLFPDSSQLKDLTLLLQSAAVNLATTNDSASQDRNSMARRYSVYPLYSLFTQKPGAGETEVLSQSYFIMLGLIVADIWLSQSPWNPIPPGFGGFVKELRILRKDNRFKDLPRVNFDASSPEDIFGNEKHELIPKARKLIGRISDRVESVSSNSKPMEPDDDLTRDFGQEDVWVVNHRKVGRPSVTRRPPTSKPEKITLVPLPPPEDGVDLAEQEVAGEIVKAPTQTRTEELPDIRSQKAAGLESRFASEFDNQLLPSRWEALNHYEIDTIIDYIKKHLTGSPETEMKTGALVAALCIITGRSPEDLARLGIFRTGTPKQTAFPAIFLSSNCWFSPFPKFDRFRPDAEQSKWLNQVGDGCFLPMPSELITVLQEIGPAETLGDALTLNADQLAEVLSKFCSTVRRDARTRVNVGWLRSIMFNRLYALTKDDVGCSATLGKTEFSPMVGLFYATFDSERWGGHYKEALESLSLSPAMPSDISNLLYGSRQFPDKSKLEGWIGEYAEKVTAKISKAKTLSEIAEAHNLLASYTFLMMLANTGHRPSVQYSFSRSGISLDKGWAIISDKITSSATRVRLIPLADVVVTQLEAYFSHLKNLSDRISKFNVELAAKISMLLDGTDGRVFLPLFFTLDERLVPEAVNTCKCSWPFEMNASRHFLATGLREAQINAEYIACLLAHVENGQFAFSRFSCLSPASWQAEMLPALNGFLTSMGWRPVTGMAHSRKPPIDFGEMKKQLECLDEIDPFAKARSHVLTSNEDRRAVRIAFGNARRSTPRNASAAEFLEKFENEIKLQSVDVPDRLGIRLNYHVRYVRMHRHALKATSIPGWATDMCTEDTPFEPKGLLEYEMAEKIRKRLLEVATEVSSASPDEHLALIMLSAIFYGGLLRKELVEKLPDVLFTSVRQFNDEIWIDFDDPQSGGCQRWFPDSVTILLIGRLLSMPAVGKEGKLAQVLAAILKQVTHNNLTGIDIRSKDLVEAMTKLAGAYFAIQLPGLLRAYSTGDIRSASLPEPVYLRLLSGKPLAPEESFEQVDRGTMAHYPSPSFDGKVGQDILRKMFRAIRDVFPPSNSGATNLKGERKNRLSALSKKLKLISEEHVSMPSVVFALLAWADHLATHGSVIVSKPSTGTVYDYLTNISSMLVNLASEVDFLELSDAELEDIYQRVIEYGKESRRPDIAKTLRRFHEFCEEEFDLADVDWGEVAPGLTTNYERVSANLITHQEYQNAKSWITNHPGLGKRERQMYTLALVLLYRCGLRLGELLRLTVSDVILHEKRNTLLIRNGIYGKTKSRAGVRQIFWLDRLEHDELQLLRDWMDHRKTITKDDPWGALFGNVIEPRVLEMRAEFSRVLTHALRMVTGDMTVRIHHLRHGAGTNALTLAFGDSCSGKVFDNAAEWFGSRSRSPSKEFCEFHLHGTLPSRRLVYAISMTLGHSSPRTTAWYYGHSLDLLLGKHVDKLVHLKNVEIGRLSGMGKNLLNVMVSKSHGTAPLLIARRWIFGKLSGLTPHTKLADSYVNLDQHQYQNEIIPISSIAMGHTILADLRNGFPVWKIAARHARENIEVELLKKAAKKVERRSGYLKYELSTSGRGKEKSTHRDHEVGNLKLGSLAGLATKFEDALKTAKSKDSFQDGLDVWKDNYQKSRRSLKIHDEEDRIAFMKFLKRIGVDESQFIILNKDIVESVQDTDDGQKKKSSKSVSHVYRKSASAPSGQKQHNATSAMRKIHQICFLGAALLDYKQMLRQQTASSKQFF